MGCVFFFFLVLILLGWVLGIEQRVEAHRTRVEYKVLTKAMMVEK